jgi:hypothetical protein
VVVETPCEKGARRKGFVDLVSGSELELVFLQRRLWQQTAGCGGGGAGAGAGAGAGTEVEDVHALADIRVMKIEDIRAELRQHLIRPSKRRKPELTLLLAAARKKAKEVPPFDSRA